MENKDNRTEEQLRRELQVNNAMIKNLMTDLENYRNLVHRLNEEISKETEYRKYWQNQMLDKKGKLEADILESLKYGYYEDFIN